MITLGSNNINKIQLGNVPVTKAYLGDNLVYSQVIQNFKTAIIADGGAFDEALFTNGLTSLDPVLQRDGKVFLVPGAYKPGTIYGMGQNGELVKFNSTRTSAATYWDKNGVMQQAAINIPRIQFDPATKKCLGYLLEATSTNLLLNSGLVSLTNWNRNAGSVIPVDTGWNRGALLEKGVKVSQSGANNNLYQVYAATKQNTNYVLTFYVRMSDNAVPSLGTGPTNDFAPVVTGGVPMSTTTIKNVFGSVYQVTSKMNSGTLTTFNYGLIKYGTQSSKEFICTGFQLEEAIEASSYMPTATAMVTRARDLMQSEVDIIPYTVASVYMDFNPLVPSGSVLLSYKGSNGRFWYCLDDRMVAMYNGAITTGFNLPQIPKNSGVIKTLSSYKSTELVTSAKGLMTRAVTPTTNFGVGSLVLSTTTSIFISNLVRSLIVVDKGYPDVEMQRLTT